ncbi:MAG: class I SAM-dependent methyltransferase [Deltaproteobacteria bacterium]|nr:MAG: class I SAM-dependent methyltransferase [Deltaproteobacteria bacterium]
MNATGQRELKVARVLDREVAPLWHDRFARVMFRDLPPLEEGIVLDAAAETGRTTLELLARYGPKVRVVGLERDPAKLELARARIDPHFRDRVYLKHGDPTEVAKMADDTYAAVFANLVVGESPEPEQLLAEFVRVVQPGGEVRATLPLRGTWAEVEDLLYEILLHAGASDAVRRLSRLARLRPTGPALADRLRSAGIEPDRLVIEQRRMQLVFPGGREFLFSPAIEYGPLRLWKAIIGKGNEPQKVFWQLKESIDTYFAGRVFCVTVVLGNVRIEVPKGAEEPLARRIFGAYPELAGLFFADTTAARDTEDDFELDIDIDEEPEVPAAADAGPDEDLESSFADLGRELALAAQTEAEARDAEESDTADVLGAFEEVRDGEDLESMFEELDAEMHLLPADPTPVPATDARPRTGVRLAAVTGTQAPVDKPPPPPRRRPPPPPPKPTMRMRKPPPPPPPRGKKKP